MAANGALPGGQDPCNPLAGNPKYQTVRELGAGSFGIVQLAINKCVNASAHLLILLHTP